MIRENCGICSPARLGYQNSSLSGSRMVRYVLLRWRSTDGRRPLAGQEEARSP